MLVAQARLEALSFVTAHQLLSRYEIHLVDARDRSSTPSHGRFGWSGR